MTGRGRGTSFSWDRKPVTATANIASSELGMVILLINDGFFRRTDDLQLIIL
jgi:hypothetical protein